MSLDKYRNFGSIVSLSSAHYGSIFDINELQNINFETLIPIFEKINPDLSPEIHVYTFNGDYVGSSYQNELINHGESNSLLIDVRKVFADANLTKGSYKIAVNILMNVLGDPSFFQSKESRPLFVSEVSPDRSEIKFKYDQSVQLIEFQEAVQYLKDNNALNNLVANFGRNQVYKTLNIKFEDDAIYVKLYRELSSDVVVNDRCYFGIEMADTYIDTVILSEAETQIQTNKLSGPNFDYDIDQYNSNSTVFKTWNELLDSDSNTSQKIIDTIISGSEGVTLNIDYTNYDKYIHYSSAKERIANFHYKMKLAESYSLDVSNLQASSGSGSTFVDLTVNQNINRIDGIVSNLDPFERWMYYSDSGSIFTHGISGSQEPWPKYKSGGMLHPHSVTSSLVQTWYTDSIYSASLYDSGNVNSLSYTIPEHILMDSNNSQYILFVDMVGQHFDNMYSYINALTSIHSKDEHPDRGTSKELLYHVAKSFGWNLQNTRETSDLWLYKLGTDSTGQEVTSSNLTIRSHEDQTYQIWKRIVNNLPYLLKTKGTSRSIKALMSIYGIPKTLLSIKEYGGPSLDDSGSLWEEDRFMYDINTISGSYIKIPADEISTNWYSGSQYGWGNGSWCSDPLNFSSQTSVPSTYEFRFSTDQSGSSDPIYLFGGFNSIGKPKLAATLHTTDQLIGSSSISGSTKYGKLNILSKVSGSIFEENFSTYLPLFDSDKWTLNIYEVDASSSLWAYRIGKYSDCTSGDPVHYYSGSFTYNKNSISYFTLGGADTIHLNSVDDLLSSSSLNYSVSNDHYNGYVQAYKEYYTSYSDQTFHSHLKNPNGYYVDSISGSFYSLYRYHPLGLDNQRWDHDTEMLFMSSSHPDQTAQSPSPIEYINFSGSQSEQYRSTTERFYIEIPKIAGNSVQNNKIRTEDSTLRYELSPENRSEISAYDYERLDSDRLAIVFSLSDQINRDIFDHMGYGNLDSWIANPGDIDGYEYTQLESKKNEYFQKYQQKNDINSFIRILSAYDYTFFEQIKQLTPARADLISGILIEPHMFNRPKVVISRKPIVTNPQWDDSISYSITEQGNFVTYTSSIENSQEVDVVVNKMSGSINHESLIEYEYNKYSGSIIDPIELDVENITKHSSSIEMIDSYTGFSSGSNIATISGSRLDCRYKKKTCHFEAFRIKDSLPENSILDTLGVWYQSGSVTSVSESIEFLNVYTTKFKRGAQITAESSISQSISTESGSNYFLRLYARPVDTGSFAEFKFKVNDVENGTSNIVGGQSGSLQWVNEYRFGFSGSGTDSIELISVTNDMIIYSAEIYTYISKWEEGWLQQAYRCLNLPVACSLQKWSYQNEEHLERNNHRFKGSKLIGPGINIDSPNTINGTPVVIIRESNPNSLGIGDGGSEGNLRLS